MRKRILISALAVMVLFTGVVGVFGIIRIGEAQQAKSEVAELTELASALNNADAFMAGLGYLQERTIGIFGGTTEDDWNVGGALNVTGATTLTGATTITGDATIGIVVTGGGAYNSTTTDAATYTLVSADIATYSYLDFDHTGAANITYTMPATSTMMTLLPSIGSTRSWTMHNASTTAVMTVAAGAGTNLLGIDTDVDTIAADGWATLECTQSVYVDSINENIACLMAEYLVAD